MPGSEAVRPRHSQQAVARRGKTTGGVRGGLRAADGRGRFLQEEDDEEETTTDGDLDGDDDETTAPEEGEAIERYTDSAHQSASSRGIMRCPPPATWTRCR